MLDLVLTGGALHDGTGAAPYVADLGIRDGRIAAIGRLDDAAADERVAVDGLVVAPGFIDLHTHSDFTLLVNGRAESQVHQGVTTEVVGQCGFSCAPVVDDCAIAHNSVGFQEGRVPLGWRSFGAYLDRLEATPLGVNVAAFVGHGALHRAVLGEALRAPEPDELDRMVALADQAFDEGATGLSTGLEYWPGSLSTVEHLVPVCAAAGRHGRLYATHVRNRDVFYDLGFGEALATARAAGARLQISHIQPKFGAPDHAMEHTLEMLGAARRQGVDVAFDVIPHDWSHTKVAAILPAWALEGGVGAILDRLRDPEARRRMRRNPKPMWRLVPAGRWQDIVLLRSESNRGLVGATFAEIGRSRGVDPFEAMLDLLLEEGEGLHQLLWTSHGFSDADVRLCLAQPECAVISDTLALAPYGALEGMIGSLSGYGWAARLFETYVRDTRTLTLAEAISKVTAVPAARLGLADRGVLRAGACADVAVIDADRIASHCTVAEPTRYATGIAHVLVNGRFAMRDGARTAVDAGHVLRGGGA